MRTKLRRAAGTVLAATVAGLVLVAVFGSAASAGPRPGRVAAAGNPVVPVGGTVAGKGYAYWLERATLINFVTAHPTTCTTVSVGGVRVAMLMGSVGPSGTASFTCSEPTGRAIYEAAISDECSTLKMDHVGFGTTPADLEKCASVEWDSGTIGTGSFSLTLDGHSVDVQKLVTATGEFYVPKVTAGSSVCRDLGTPTCAPTAHSAAYGAGLLLSGLPKGTHILHNNGNGPFDQHWKATYTIHVG